MPRQPKFRSPQPRRIRPGFAFRSRTEALEVRILPTVTASVTRGVLTLTGDAAANDVTIQTDAGGLRIVGNNGTLVRFAGVDSASVVFSGVTGLKGTFGDGADSIKIDDGVTLKDVTLNLGDGANRLEIEGATLTGKLTLTTGVGADVFELRASAANVVTLNTGGGDDDVMFKAAVTSGAVTVSTGDGFDSVETDLGPGGVANVLQNVSISTGNQDDSVELRHATIGKLTVNAGAGNDDIRLEDDVVQGSLSVDAGLGDDEVFLDDVQQTGGGSNLLATGAGVDQLRLKTSLFTSATTTNLGGGTGNQLEIDDCGFQASVTLTSAGTSDEIRIEQDNARASLADFHGTVKATVGPASAIRIGLNAMASYTRFFAGVTLKGGRPFAQVTAAATRIEFASPPILINAELETI